MPKTAAADVWQILVEECEAEQSEEPSFEALWPCNEYRFIGALGFGGKVRAKYVRPFGDDNLVVTVDCYPEDLNEERSAMIAQANERLASL